MNKLKTFLGLRGSWKWACRQLKKGEIIYRTSDTGSCKYKLDDENQSRIQCAYIGRPDKVTKWVNAIIFLDDFTCTDWEVYKGALEFHYVKKTT